MNFLLFPNGIKTKRTESLSSWTVEHDKVCVFIFMRKKCPHQRYGSGSQSTKSSTWESAWTPLKLAMMQWMNKIATMHSLFSWINFFDVVISFWKLGLHYLKNDFTGPQHQRSVENWVRKRPKRNLLRDEEHENWNLDLHRTTLETFCSEMAVALTKESGCCSLNEWIDSSS